MSGDMVDVPLAMTAKDVAAVLRISERHALRLMSRGELGPTSRVGGRVRILREVLFKTLGGDNDRRAAR